MNNNCLNILKWTEAQLKYTYDVSLQEATPQELHEALGQAVMMAISDDWSHSKKTRMPNRKAYYISAEYLIGRLVYSNLFNLGILDEMKELFAEHGVDLAILEDIEDDALGNGGLGRLAACFLDSAASTDIPLSGYGLRYKFGLFKQSFDADGSQVENADDWTKFGDPWSFRRYNHTVKVKFPDHTVLAVPYDVPVIGYETTTVGTLRLWQCEAEEELNFDAFNAQDYVKALEKKNKAEDITRVLYPNDSTWEGKRLRIKQQYVLSSASLQDMLRTFKIAHGDDLSRFAEFYAVQLNDTHPAMSIPELIRLLMAEGMSFDDAFNVAQKTFSYTNHTVMAEALEKWNVDIFKMTLPRIYQIVVEMDRRAREKLEAAFPGDQGKINYMALIGDNQVRMANICAYTANSINGVSKLHSEIIKDSVFHDYYLFKPQAFKNVTNGIAYRRWLLASNPELCKLLDETIGDGYKHDASDLTKLNKYADDKTVLKKLNEIKLDNKKNFAAYLEKSTGQVIDPNSIFDCQVKRMHEYKRQHLNALNIAAQYLYLKENPNADFIPKTYIFGAKAAPGYYMAKQMIRMICKLGDLINNDPAVRDKLRVVYLEEYCVSLSEHLMPAAEVSEQISLAGTEASGTGNMKFMLNGANVEISQQVGEENIYIFGQTSDQVIHRYAVGDYDPAQWVEGDANIRRAISFLTGPEMLAAGHAENLTRLHDELIHKDWFQTLPDFNAYVVRKGQALSDYACDPTGWRRKCLVNIAKAGMFSSDRTIAEYDRDIWHLGK